ncbi:MAG: hypothetical protein M3174_06430 [Actinomycetota bacterium]|nr:hypothetical protein [Actinomycetota bacterium]
MAKVPARIKARGLREVAGLGIQRVREAIRSDDELVFFARPSGGEVPDVPKWEGLIFKRAQRSDSAAFARDIGTDSAATFESRLTNGTRCYLVLEGPKILHSTWVTTTASWVREIARYFLPPAGDAYVYESFTRADARGRGVYPFALHHIARDLAGDRVVRVWVAVEADNEPSLRAISKAGFEKSFELSYRRRFGRLTLDPLRGPGAEQASHWFVRKLRDEK